MSDDSLSYLMAGIGKKKSPYESRRALAQQMIQQGSDTSPVLSPWQGVGRLGQALAGAFSNYAIDASEKQAGTDLAAKIAAAGTEKDPVKRLAAYTAIDPEIGLKYSAQSAADEAKLKRTRDDDAQAAGFLLGTGGNTQQAGGAAGAIGGIESGGRYDAVGPVANAQGNRAYGKYQVLDSNIGPWTTEILGKPMTKEEFLANPQAQDKVFQTKFNQYQQQYGSPEAASRAWFAGPGGMNNLNAKDVLGTTVQGYGQKFAQAYGPGAGGTNLAQGSADGSGNPLPPQRQTADPGAQFEAAAIRAQQAGRGDIAMKYIQQATAAREAAAKSDAGRALVPREEGPDLVWYDPRTGAEAKRVAGGAKKPPAEGGAFGGTGMDAQARNALVRAAKDPAYAQSPEYAAAHSFLSQPRQSFDESRGVMVTLPPADLSAFPPPTFRAGQQAPQGAPEGMPQQLGDPSLQAASGMPPAPSPSVVAGPTMQASPAPPAGPVVTPVQGLPAKAPTAEQSLAGGFTDRMANSNGLLGQLEGAGLSATGRLNEKIPFLGNYRQTPEYRQYTQARDDFINAQLRRESGAAISDAEYDRANKQYFPQPGDDPGTVAQKAKNRLLVVDAMRRNAGSGYAPNPAIGGTPAQGSAGGGQAPTEYDYVGGKLVPRK